MKITRLIRVDFHCHTYRSRDSLARPGHLLEACQRKGIDRLVISDHNTIRGAVECQKLDPSRAIIGEEVMTETGELLGIFVTEEVPPGLPVMEAIRLLRAQGAFISISHPFDVYRKGHWHKEQLLEILPYVDAIETFNARCLRAEFNRQAEALAHQQQIAGTVGSDAHAACEVGQASLLLPEFHDRESLKYALGYAQAQTRLSAPWVHLISRYAKWRKGKEMPVIVQGK